MDKVLFVCTANICRSPMAASIFDVLAEDEGLELRAESAGISALVNEPMAPHAITALREAGFYPAAHHARQVDKTMIEEASLVLAMSPRQAAKLRVLHPDASPRVNTLLEYATGAPTSEGIPDPYGYPLSTYRSALRQIYDYVERTVHNLKR